MFSIKNAIKPHFRQIPMTEISRGDAINIIGDWNSTTLVESCECHEHFVIVKLIGEPPLKVSKDRVVTVYSYH